MAAGQREVCLLVIGQRECGRPVSLEIVATVACVEIRRGSELASMTIGVTLRAAVELDLK